MRVPRLRLTAVLGAIGVLAGALIGAEPAFAASSASLIVNPSEGRADTQISVTYEVSRRAGSTCPAPVDFTWDGNHWRSVFLPKLGTATCVYAFRAAPPDRTPGPHDIGAGGLHSIFTIIGRAASATPTPSRPTTGHTAAPTSTYDDTATQPGAGVNTSQGAVAPLDAGGSVLGAATADSGGGSGATAWILIFGGLLVLGGLAIFGLLVYWSRRGGGDGPVDSDTDGPVDSDTEVLSA